MPIIEKDLLRWLINAKEHVDLLGMLADHRNDRAEADACYQAGNLLHDRAAKMRQRLEPAKQ